MSGPQTTESEIRLRYGFWLVLAGIIAVVVVFIAAGTRWSDAADVAAVVGSVTGIIGTLVGAFFGFQAGSEGRREAEESRDQAEARAMKLAAHLEPRTAAKVLADA